MAEALKIGVCDLVAEFLAHAFVFGGALPSAGTVAAGLFKSLFYESDRFGVRIVRDLHFALLLSVLYTVYRDFMSISRYFDIN